MQRVLLYSLRLHTSSWMTLDSLRLNLQANRFLGPDFLSLVDAVHWCSTPSRFQLSSQLTCHHILVYYDFKSSLLLPLADRDCGTERYSVFVTNQLSRCRHGSAESNLIKISNLVEFPIGSTT
jgi:hypothetical protein